MPGQSSCRTSGSCQRGAGVTSRTRRALAGLVICAAALLIISTRTWVTATFIESGSPTLSLGITGRAIEPLGAGAAWALIAGAIAFGITSGVLRRLVSTVLMVLSLTSLVSAVNAHGSAGATEANRAISQAVGRTVIATELSETYFWLFAAVLSLVAVTLSTILLLAPKVLATPSRYNRATEDSDLTTWQAIDAGLDPTQD